MGESPDGISGAISSVAVVPGRYLALVLSALHVWGHTRDGLVVVAVTKATHSVVGTVLRFVIRLDLEAFVAECWLFKGGSLVGVEEGDVTNVVWRALCASQARDVSTDWGLGRGLGVDLAEDPCGESCVDEPPSHFKEGIVIHADVFFQRLEVSGEHSLPHDLCAEAHYICGDAWVSKLVYVVVHQFFHTSVGVEHMEMVIADLFVIPQVWDRVGSACVQRLAVDGAELAIAALDDRFFAIEDETNIICWTGYIPFQDFNPIMLQVQLVVGHPIAAWVVRVVFFV